MAGAGYKLFGAGDILTAGQVNTFLNEQSVMVFATTAARDAALTSVLAEGMTCYVKDNGSTVAEFQVYDGAAWNVVWDEGTAAATQSGVISTSTNSAGVVGVTFPTAFATKPNCIVSIESSGTSTAAYCSVYGPGTNSTTLQVSCWNAAGRINSAAVVVTWIAVAA